MQKHESILIYGPDQAFNSALVVELGRKGLTATVGDTGVEAMRERARANHTPFVFLDCEFVPGWGIDMLFALHKLFPKSALFLCSNKFDLNKRALEELGVKCYIRREEGVHKVAAHLCECVRELKDQSSNVS